MTAHSRTRSKSNSIFSLDTLRSFSRAGIYQANRVLDDNDLLHRSPSNQSHTCDPNVQSPSSTTSPYRFDTSTLKEASPLLGDEPTSQNIVQPSGPGVRVEKLRKRALTWLPLFAAARRTYPRKLSVQLPQERSSSTVARSIISAPVLTSTTNVDVAKIEGVRCGELSETDFHDSTWNGQVGWIPSSEALQGTLTTRQAQALAENIDAASVRAWPRQKSQRGRLSRFGEVVRGRLRRTSESEAGVFFKINEETPMQSTTTMDQRIARCRAETVNLCKSKIKHLTGSGHIKRKCVHGTNSDVRADAGKNNPLLSPEVASAPRVGLTQSGLVGFDADKGDDNDSHFGSLSRSFNSALDKLGQPDVQPSGLSSMAFLRSRSSIFNLKKPSGEQPPTGAGHIRPVQQMLPTPHCHDGAPDPPKSPSKTACPIDKLEKSDPEPSVFSARHGGYIPVEAHTGYPGGVNPLRAHPNTTEFASPPPGITVTRQPMKSHPGQLLEAIDNDYDEGIENAPIFSPSLGDLSQYARETPPLTPKPAKPSMTGPLQHQTPTKGGGSKQVIAGGNGGLRKSRSRFGLFSKTKIMGDQQQKEKASHFDLQVLNQRDQNAPASSGKQIKKSRSMNFGFFNTNETPPPVPSMCQDLAAAFAPSTPSPLRQETRVRGESTKVRDLKKNTEQ